MTTSPISGATAQPSSTASASAATAAAGLGNQQVFLQLLIAQLKNQDPSNPTDGTQFVTQLAQFTTLEQETGAKSDLDAILKVVQAQQAATPTTTAA